MRQERNDKIVTLNEAKIIRVHRQILLGTQGFTTSIQDDRNLVDQTDQIHLCYDNSTFLLNWLPYGVAVML